MAAMSEAGGDGLVAWAARSGRPRTGRPVRGGLRFAFYGRVSTEDWQDPVTSRARQREQAGARARGHGGIVAEYFDAGEKPNGGVGPQLAGRRSSRSPARFGPGLGRDRDRGV